jgi:hypothetical protein
MTPAVSFHLMDVVFVGSPPVPTSSSVDGKVTACTALAPSATMIPYCVGDATPKPPFAGGKTLAPTAFALARLSDWNSGSAELPFATSGVPDAELGPTPTMFDVLSPTSTE